MAKAILDAIEQLEIYTELRCAICGSRLQPGDQKDHLWPYFSKHNRCRKCLKEEKTRK